MRRVTCLLPALLLFALFAACRTPAPAWPEQNVLVVALENAPTHLDPRVGTDKSSGQVFQLVFNGLVSKDPAGALVPDLAERWEVLESGTRYRFHLRPGVAFHDGRLLSAEDVAWTFGTILDGTVATAKRGAFGKVRRLEVKGPLVVDFVLAEPYGALLVSLTPYVGIVPAGVGPEEMNRNPVGTGPFRFLSRTADTVTLGAFEGYRAGRPHLDRVVLREVPDATVRALELQRGSVQLALNALSPDVLPLFRRSPHHRVEVGPSASFSYLGLNLRDPVLADVRVRRALAHAIDRPRLVNTLWRGLGVVSDTIFPEGHWARHDGLDPIPHDPAAARRLLDEAGLPDRDGPGGRPRVSLTYKTSTSEPYVLQAQVIQAMLAEVGIDLQIRSFEFATFYNDVQRGNFQIFSLHRFGVVDPDLYTLILHSGMTPPAGQNRGHYRNPEFDRLIEEGVRRLDPEERRPFYLRAQEILARDLPYILLYNQRNAAVLAAPLAGYENDSGGELSCLEGVRWVR